MFLVEYQNNDFVDIDGLAAIRVLGDNVEFTLKADVSEVYNVSKSLKSKFLSMLQYRDTGKELIAERYEVYGEYSQE